MVCDNSIFHVFSINREKIHWEDYLYSLTPVEKVESVYFKREDKFAPLGYGGINGSKLRQCIYLINKYYGSYRGVISGASVKSPQLSMGTAVATHYGLPSVHVIGGKSETSLRHPNVEIASRLGAEFIYSAVAYNPVLQKRVRDLLATDYSGYYYLNYGISVAQDATPEEIEGFHRVGAEQVRNLPDDMEDLVIPAGSCNSAVSILYGLSKYPPQSLKKIWLIGIGPSKLEMLNRRLLAIQSVVDFQMKNWLVWYEDLHAMEYTTYQDEVKWAHGDIEMHPTYEGKVMKYLTEKRLELLNERTCIWLVGSKPSWQAMEAYV